ncbi:MAG: sulfotransferase domain-containing protein [Anaerolineae bacterium]|nr:sulfotransferase domain-containing protein [Anaerolineae bacterium]
MDFNQAIQEREDFLRMGLYHKHLTRFYNRFPKENIQVLLFDDLKEDNRAFLREVERFLGVREYIPDSIDKASNVTGVPRFGLANKLIFRFRVFARKRNLSVVTEFLRLSGLSKLSRLVMRKNTKPFDSKPKLTEENQKKLKDYYREDIAQLERLIERDLSGWKQ